MRHPRVREAIASDVPDMHAIYMHRLATAPCVVRTEPSTASELRARLEERDRAYPVFVAEKTGEIVAWASLRRFGHGGGFSRTTEVNLYVRDDHRGYGLGRLLLSALISRARELGHHALVSSVAADEIGLLSLHRSVGFEDVGRLEEVGFQDGRWIDLVYLELLLEPAPRSRGAASGSIALREP